MRLILANPVGLWALLAVPAILLIHFLQTRPREVRVSTLFLLDPLRLASRGGRRWNRLRQSLPLWLQLLAAIFMALFLAEPRWVRPGSAQEIVVVLDSSVSMQASADRVARLLPERLGLINKDAQDTHWTLLESDTLRPVLYRGGSLGELFAALSRWHPTLGAHDFSPALRAAQAVVRGAGRTILVTDRRAEVPDGVETLALGEPLANCG